MTALGNRSYSPETRQVVTIGFERVLSWSCFRVERDEPVAYAVRCLDPHVRHHPQRTTGFDGWGSGLLHRAERGCRMIAGAMLNFFYSTSTVPFLGLAVCHSLV